MKGFDPKFKDFPDYIIGITKEIWEDRGIATLHEYYAEDIIVRSPDSVIKGNQGVIAATMATLNEFPDRTLYGEDVIWSGTPKEGMLSSHRLHSTGTHANHGIYGKPMRKNIHYRAIADCHAINNQINDEWLIRDQGAIIRQLGWKPDDYARHKIEVEGGVEKAIKPFTPEIDIKGPYQGCGNDNEWGEILADILNRIMNADFTTIPENYDRAANLYYPGGVEALSFEGADAFWMGLRASFPSAEFKIHHQIGRDDPLMPPRAAIRWSLNGKHNGWGSFGHPTGANVHVMGITHVEFGPFGGANNKYGVGIRREYTLFDETAIWKQIVLQEG